jgi:caa(3)-type oxidase subunit IV
MGHVNRREYWVIFAWLFVLTVLEVSVVYLKPVIGQAPVVLALVLMALTKASLVGLFYMHLKHETPILKATVAIPMSLPMIYAIILIAEAAWRIVGEGHARG